jgi:N-acetylglucosaminyldiphosphoundecaprenol N-acetyl-beta-D-mannosaminyltransferase
MRRIGISDMGDTTTRTAGHISRPNERSITPIVRVRVAGLNFSSLTEAQVTAYVVRESKAGRGGWVATPNVDICQKSSADPAMRRLLGSASLIVPDGMPLIWAARLAGRPLPERVSGSSLINTLSSAAARGNLAIYLLGGAPGVPERARLALIRRNPGLRVVGADAPRFGFDQSPAEVADVRNRLGAARPDIVFVGLGFPKQEQLIAQFTAAFPRTWFVGCGAAIPFAAGTVPRAPAWMQDRGLEWLFRLVTEPRRLFRRYLIDDVPYALMLLAGALAQRARRIPAK